MRRCLPLLASALVLGACQSSPPPVSPVSPASPSAAVPTGAADTCDAAGHAALLGKPHDAVPAAPAGKVIRVVCSTCPMTMDYNAARLNVIFDAKSGVVQKLTCG